MIYGNTQDNAYRVVFAVQRQDDQPATRIDTGLTAMWVLNELVIPINADAEGVLRNVAQTVRRETTGHGGTPR